MIMLMIIRLMLIVFIIDIGELRNSMVISIMVVVLIVDYSV